MEARRRSRRGPGRGASGSAPSSSSCRSGGHRSTRGRTSAATAPGRATSGSRVLSAASRPRCVGRHAGRACARRLHARARRHCTSRSTSAAGPIDLVGVHLTSRLPYGPPIQLRRLRAQLPPAGRPGDRGRRLQLLGSGRRWRSSPAGSGRCAGARGPPAGRTARSTTSWCATDRRHGRGARPPRCCPTSAPTTARCAPRSRCGRTSSHDSRTRSEVWCHARRARRSRSEVVVPEPGPGEARVTVQACGVCHTDLHYREGAINDDFPFLLGHEAAGRRRVGRARRRATSRPATS